MIMKRTILLLLVFIEHYVNANSDDTATSAQPSAATTFGSLFRQARSEHFYPVIKYAEEVQPQTAARSDILEQRDSSYYESRCITCDPAKSSATPVDRDSYQGRWRQRTKFDYYDDELEDRRYRDRYDPYYDRTRNSAYDYDRYDPYGRNDLFRPAVYNDRYDPYERDRYYGRPGERPIDRPLIDRPSERPVERPLIERAQNERPYDRSYERGNGYDNLDARYPYDERYDRYGPPRRPPYEEYEPMRYDRYNANRNYGRYDSRYDRYDPYDRVAYRRPPTYDDRYDKYSGGGRSSVSDPRGYYGSNYPVTGAVDRPAYASAWNYAGGNRDNWRDVNRDRERDRDRDRNRDRDVGFYRPRDYFYDSTAAPGGSRGTSYLYDRAESSTKSDLDREKSTNLPQTQDTGKTYKD